MPGFFTEYQDKVGGVTYNRESLYNGNIAAMATSIRHFGELKSTQSMNYRYDQLHCIAAAHVSKWEGIWTTVEGSYNTSYAYDGNGNIQNLYRNNLEATTIDELYYHYDPVKKNRLDVVKDGGTAEGLNNATPYQYKYDKIGNLVQNTTDGIENIEWNIYGKVEKVTKTPDPFGIQATVEYRYDGTGNRIMKKVSAGATSTTTTYLRDASGNVMAIYEEKTDQTLAVKEIPIYGSSRLGQYRPKTDTKKTALGQRIYEFSNHLGNVLVTLTDNKVPQTDGTYSSVVVSASDYYPFGMAMKERSFSNEEYRFGFNTQEKSTEIGEDTYTAEFWQYDSKIARRWNVDPVVKPYESSYLAFGGNPIYYVDVNGDNASTHTDKDGNVIAVYDDGDNGVYRHDDISVEAKTPEGIDKAAKKLEQKITNIFTTGSEQEQGNWGGKNVGSTEYWDEFLYPMSAKPYNEYGVTRRIEFGQKWDEMLINAEKQATGMSLAEVAANSHNNGIFSLQDQAGPVGRLYQGKYITSQSVGNYLVGFLTATHNQNSFTISFETFQKMAGALHDANHKGSELGDYEKGLIYLFGRFGYYRGESPTYGEVEYQRRMSYKGYNDASNIMGKAVTDVPWSQLIFGKKLYNLFSNSND